MKTVRFTKFDYSLGADNNSKVLVKMSGVAEGYRAIALQSDLFSKNKFFINPVFSNLALDSQGNVAFDLEFFVDSNFVNYKNILENKSAVAPVQSIPAIVPPVTSDNKVVN